VQRWVGYPEQLICIQITTDEEYNKENQVKYLKYIQTRFEILLDVSFLQKCIITQFCTPCSFFKQGTTHILRELEEENQLKFAGDKVTKGVIYIPKSGDRLYSGTRYVFKTLNRFKELVADISEKIPSIQMSQFKYSIEYPETTDETEDQVEKNKDIAALENRCREMLSLKDGWYYGEGKSYSVGMMNTIDSIIRRLLDYEVPLPIFGPSPDGSVEIEWQEYDIHVFLSENIESVPQFKFDVLTGESEKESIFTDGEEFIAFIKANFN